MFDCRLGKWAAQINSAEIVNQLKTGLITDKGETVITNLKASANFQFFDTM